MTNKSGKPDTPKKLNDDDLDQVAGGFENAVLDFALTGDSNFAPPEDVQGLTSKPSTKPSSKLKLKK